MNVYFGKEVERQKRIMYYQYRKIAFKTVNKEENMIKGVKRFSAAVLSAVMVLTAVATPLGDNLPAVRDSVSVTAGRTVIGLEALHTDIMLTIAPHLTKLRRL